jgi:hypothetical protein
MSKTAGLPMTVHGQLSQPLAAADVQKQGKVAEVFGFIW